MQTLNTLSVGMSIIYLLGEDKAGKSTLTRLLIEHLRSKGYKVCGAWMRGSHTLASIISKLLSKSQVFHWEENPYYGIHIPRNAVKLWWFIEYISILPIILKRYLIPSKFGIIVVADRYVIDFIVWVSIITDSPSFKDSIYARHLLALSRRIKFKFYVTASDEEIRRRSNEKIMSLNMQKRLYESLSKDAFKIDTTGKAPQESLKEIINILENLWFK